MNEKWHRLIVENAYGDASWWTRFRVKRRLRRDPQAEAVYRQYRLQADAIHRAVAPVCPEALRQRLLRIPSNFPRSAIHAKTMSQAGLRPGRLPFALGSLALTGLALMAALLFFRSEPPPPIASPVFSDTDVVRAEREATYAFALVRRELQRTSTLPLEILSQEIEQIVIKTKERT